MKQLKMNVSEFDGYAITVEINECSLSEYAKTFLHIFNNVRENKELVKIENHYGTNDITVYCMSDVKDKVVKYLENYGRIKDCDFVLMYQLEKPDYDINKYDDAVVVTDFD